MTPPSLFASCPCLCKIMRGKDRLFIWANIFPRVWEGPGSSSFEGQTDSLTKKMFYLDNLSSGSKLFGNCMGETKGCQEKSISSNTKNTGEVASIKNKRDLNDDSDLLLDRSGRMLIMWKRQKSFLHFRKKRMPSNSWSLQVFINCPLVWAGDQKSNQAWSSGLYHLWNCLSKLYIEQSK